ncbi:hypothetical protein ABZ863_25185 [Saccharomonospora sp. NPDC046836]|uniref:hypothetical protein n=1 Tax=Saccharomonospora sp. NPDC046836 TaxID=3156921 RepID=UPI0033F78F5F
MVTELMPRRRTLLSAAIFGVLLVIAVPLPAAAAPRLSVSQTSGLDPAGATITVQGSGFDVGKGIYVAVCVDNGPGQLPTPCLGGMDTSGGGGGSAWISSNPPSYGEGLATPYGPGGTFSVTLTVTARDPVTGTDCTKVSCAVVTRADHTRSSDRSQDARVPLRFGLVTPTRVVSTTTTPPPTTTAPRTTTTMETTTRPPSTSSTVPANSPPAATSTSSAAVAETAGSDGLPAGLVWWLGLGAAGLLAAVAVVVRRSRRARRADRTD